MIEVFTDGATEGYNGRLGSVSHVGIGVWCPSKDYAYSERRKGLSNNEAEYMALIEAMKWCIQEGEKEVIFACDSQLVVRGALYTKRTPCERMNAFKEEIKELKKEFTYVDFQWIPREQNKEADALSKQSLQPKRASMDEELSSSLQRATPTTFGKEAHYKEVLRKAVRLASGLYVRKALLPKEQKEYKQLMELVKPLLQ